MAAILGIFENFVKITKSTMLQILLNRARSKIFDEIALSGTVKEIEGNLCFAIFGKNSKIQNGHHFGEGKILPKITKHNPSIPCGSKIDEIALSSHG